MTCHTLSKAIKISVGADAPTLYSLEARYPRIIHSELMTHRLFSRNARSSRAVPFARLVEEVMDDPFIPRYWGKNQKGMQAGAEHDAILRWATATAGRLSREEGWLWARDRAVEAARAYDEAGYHKQIVNRLLEPWMHIDVLITTTDVKNFLWLRDDAAAEPHIRDLAKAMASSIIAYGEPQGLQEGEWHLPYTTGGDPISFKWPEPYTKGDHPISDSSTDEHFEFAKYRAGTGQEAYEVARAVSVTRCARISYKPFHGEAGDIASEIARHDQLVTARPMHASPCEHQATPDVIVGQRLNKTTGQLEPVWEYPELHGNLTGWKQYRKMLPGERA